MAGPKKLVIGASGFLGSHSPGALVERGDDVRVLIRSTSSTKSIDDLAFPGEAENLVLSYARDRGLPAVAMCVSNTYGPGDFGPTPHGMFVAAAAPGELPFYVKAVASEVVGIEDAAGALLLAAEKGCSGEGYIVSERFLSVREPAETAVDAVGSRRPRFGVPLIERCT
jgi:nucleoside-diphosphate-sugar epimerase